MFGLDVSVIVLIILGVVIPVVLALIANSVLWMKDNYVPSDDSDKKVELSNVFNGIKYNNDSTTEFLYDLWFSPMYSYLEYNNSPSHFLYDLCTNPAYSYLECNASHNTYEEMNDWLMNDMMRMDNNSVD